ncbi:hypothetical protein Q7P37_003217 [Cladosporium fusiforme]
MMNNDRARSLKIKAAKQDAKASKASKGNASKVPSTKNDASARQQSSNISRALQQKCLNVFRDALWTGPEDIAALQEVKGHLYNRDFAKAFGSEDYLRAYALRWSAARALGYMQVFDDINDHLQKRAQDDTAGFKILSLGGGAGAELASIAGWHNLTMKTNHPEASQNPVDITLVDIAAWKPISDKLDETVVSPPVISKYASAAVREAATPMVVRDKFNTTCEQSDVLEWDEETVVSKAGSMDLVTIMFTLNELYSTSVPKTQRLLKNLTAGMQLGSLLLVVDSPGSYSTVSINGAEKKYPMQWLLDHTLLGSQPEAALWDKIVTNESKWFRLLEGLEYPVELENMRYQIHMYKRRSPESG